jgi:hypothetical protein
MQKQTEAGQLKKRKPLPASGSVALFPHFKSLNPIPKPRNWLRFVKLTRTAMKYRGLVGSLTLANADWAARETPRI